MLQELTSVPHIPVYGYYHVSGTKKRMDQLRQVSETFTSVKDKAVQATPSPKAAINFLRSVANSYASKLVNQVIWSENSPAE